MPGSQPEDFLLKSKFSDFDDLAHTMRQWDLDLVQLDRGNTRADLVQFGNGTWQISRARLNRYINQRGAAPAGLRTFGLMEEGVSEGTWCGRKMSEDTLTVFSPSGEFEGVSAPDFNVYTISVSEKLLAEVAFLLGYGDLRDVLSETGEVFKCGHLRLREIRRFLRTLTRHIEKNPSKLETSELRDEIEFDLPRLLLSALESPRLEQEIPLSRLRDLSLKQALAYIAEFDREPITVQDLLRATGASERTLQYAFRERFGVSPKAYLKSRRLNAVRRELKNSDPFSTKVADVANQWGFWHMGQFAADYRRHFGELPSETLCQPAKDCT